MKNPYFDGDFSFAVPFEQYLHLCNAEMDDFINHLKDMNTSHIKTYLDPLFQYGLIDILLPLNELVPFFMDNYEQKEWWKKLIKDMENSNIVSDFDIAFHTVIRNSSYFTSNPCVPYIWRIKAGVDTIMNMTWDAIKDKAFDYLASNSSLIGIIIPGLYSYKLTADYLRFLSDYVLAQLLHTLNSSLSPVHPHNTYEKAALKHIVLKISQELGWRYYDQFRSNCSSILSRKEKEEDFYNLENDTLKDLLFTGKSIDDYVDSRYLDRIDKLNDYVNTLGISGFSNCALRTVSPLLHQCIGENDKAYKLLLESLLLPDSRFKSSDVTLLSFFRAVSQSRYDKRTILKNQMTLTWNSNIVPTRLVNTLNSIIGFYKSLSLEIPQRFKEEELQDYYDNADRFDKHFYSMYKGYPNGDDDLEALFFISPYIFENFAFVKQLELCVKIIEDESLQYSNRLYKLFQFSDLFLSLVSHINDCPRIEPKECLGLLWEDYDFTYITEKELSQVLDLTKDEIFNVYSYSQIECLKAFVETVYSECFVLPSFTAVKTFEKLIFDENTLAKELRDLQKSVAETKRTLNDFYNVIVYLFRLILNYNDTYVLLISVFIEKRDATKQLSDCIYDILKQNKNLRQEQRQDLEDFYKLLDSVISHPEIFYNKRSKTKIKKGLWVMLDALPVISNTKNFVQAGTIIASAIEDKIKEQQERLGL